MNKDTEWQNATRESVLSCPNYRCVCPDCRKLVIKKWTQARHRNGFVRCCKCRAESSIWDWASAPLSSPRYNYIRPQDQWRDVETYGRKNPRVISKNYFEGEKIATASEVQRGLISQQEADEWLGSWDARDGNGKGPGRGGPGFYIHQDEILRRLACEGEERKK